jgi:RNA polymerase sigma-70 factor, ECF subfamily
LPVQRHVGLPDGASDRGIVVAQTNLPNDEAQGAEFVRLLTTHQLDIYLYVRSLVVDSNEVADIVQDTALVLWEKRNQVGEIRDFRAWAFQIARYKVLEYRAQRKRKGLSFSDALVDELALQAPRFADVNSELIERLQRCVEQLAARDQELLAQRYASQTTCETIAERLGRPVRWVYNNLSRIRRDLLECATRRADAGRDS